MGDTVLDGPVERGTVSAGLSAGDNLQARKQSVVHGLAYTPRHQPISRVNGRRGPDHLSAQYREALCRIGAKVFLLARQCQL